jgi:C-terminal processing protease CtpA/Prc
LIDAVVGDPRVNRQGGLTVLIGRENVSAGTIVAAALDTKTKAVLIGEMTPARADNFLCECVDIVLPASGLTVTVPTERAGTGDPRPAVEPDIPYALKAADFFAGKDPALELALKNGSNAP